MLRLIPRILALMTVQRQIAASRSARPWIRVQQGVTGGVPMVTLANPPSKSAHTPNFRASLGQLPEDEGLGVPRPGVEGPGVPLPGFAGLGVRPEPEHEPQPLTRAKKRMFSKRNRASEAEIFEAIS
ncbi:hypothetical protein PanWU01x14_200190 [Parasponia andersonii]|uniref:Ribosomal protein n=1 Tax=Parasponia andersonii TaxID=3476 RepID=A0A2P5BYI9_PARAD|nr:hypothetical protein PanWU01x14_200190 [Parasponia andersonii]